VRKIDLEAQADRQQGAPMTGPEMTGPEGESR